MICRSIGESAGHFWQPAQLENVANPYFENLKHLQNPGHLPLTEASISCIYCTLLTDYDPVCQGVPAVNICNQLTNGELKVPSLIYWRFS